MNPMIGRFDNVKLISLTGAFIMSVGIVLASFCTEVCAYGGTSAIFVQRNLT